MLAMKTYWPQTQGPRPQENAVGTADSGAFKSGIPACLSLYHTLLGNSPNGSYFRSTKIKWDTFWFITVIIYNIKRNHLEFLTLIGRLQGNIET